MKIFIGWSLLFCLACHNQREKSISSASPDTSATIISKRIDTTLYIAIDTIKFVTGVLDTFKYSKVEFNEIVTYFPDLYDTFPSSPDISYYRSGVFKDIIDKMGNKKHISFGSEAGQDEYYILYTYFLKKKNGEKKFDSVRTTLIKIFNDINQLFGKLSHGGTYFGHQQTRILGYAEFYIYRYRINNDYFKKTYNISKQKEIYINSLKQFILDEESIDNNTIDKSNKDKRKSELFEKVNEINALITNYFYLKSSREFQYSNY